MPYYGDWEAVVTVIREFVEPICLESTRPYDSVLATLLFTDIVGSTAKAVELGDRAWPELLEQHHVRIRAQLSRFRGSQTVKELVAGSGIEFDDRWTAELKGVPGEWRLHAVAAGG